MVFNRLKSILATKNSRILVFVLLFALIGGAVLIISRAATPSVSLEAESGSLTQPATKISDSGASGGQAIAFGAAPPQGNLPYGAPANLKAWTLDFNDEFNGTTLDRNKWADCWWTTATPPCNGTMNRVKTLPSNIVVTGGNVVLTLSDSGNGALMASSKDVGAKVGYEFQYGYAEARVHFPGNGTKCYNWPAWWINSYPHPDGGENDIAEVLSAGDMTVNYHSPSGAHNQGIVPGYWCGGFHVYGAYRQPGKVDVYYNGNKVKSYTTDDNGDTEYLLFNVGETSGSYRAYGAASQVKVDYVRVWK